LFRCILANFKWAVMSLLLRSGFSLVAIKASLVEYRRDSCPSGRFSHLHKGTLVLCQSDHRVLGHLPDQGHSPLIAQFGRTVVPKFFHLIMMEANAFLGTFNAEEMFWYPSPDCASTQSCLRALRTIPSNSWFGFCSDMHCQPWDLT
jgi:hypothetical protein